MILIWSTLLIRSHRSFRPLQVANTFYGRRTKKYGESFSVCVCVPQFFRNSAILLSDTDKRSHSAYTFDTFFLTHIPAHISADVCIDCLLYATTDDGAGEVNNQILLRKKKKPFETFVGCAISWLSLSSVFWRIYVVVVRQMSQCDGRQWVDSGHVIIFCCRLSPVEQK